MVYRRRDSPSALVCNLPSLYIISRSNSSKTLPYELGVRGVVFSEPPERLVVGDDSGLGARNVGSEVLQGPNDAKVLGFRGRLICSGGFQGAAGARDNVLSFIQELGEYSTIGVEGDVCVEALGTVVVGEGDDRGRCEVVLQGGERLLLHHAPVKGRVLVNELVEGACQSNEVLSEPLVVGG